jgi:hypothetical protein
MRCTPRAGFRYEDNRRHDWLWLRHLARMTISRRLLAGGAALALILSVSACGGSASEEAAGSGKHQTAKPRFNAPQPGQVAPVNVLWLQGRSFEGCNGCGGPQTYSAGLVSEYELPLASGFRSDCLEFPFVGDNGARACVTINTDGRIVGSTGGGAGTYNGRTG